jgi:hypothetical protein
MLFLLTPDDLFAHILFLRSVDDRTFLLVEGETDCAVLDPHLDSTHCETLPTSAKTAAIGTALLADQQGEPGVIALVDRDWIGVLEPAASAPNVFYTDLYDMESTLFGLDPVRGRVVHAFTDRKDRLRYDATDPKYPVNVAYKASAAVASFRYASIKNLWGLGVRDFPIHTIVDLDGKKPDISLLCQIAVSKNHASQNFRDLIADVDSAYGWLEGQPALHSGHDVLNALSFVINKRFGGSARSEHLASALRAAAGCADLASTRFFWDVSAWGESAGRQVWDCSVNRRANPAQIPLARIPTEDSDISSAPASVTNDRSN